MSSPASVIGYGVSIAQDILSVFGVPTAVATRVYEDVLKKRSDDSLQALLDEVKDGKFENVDKHELVSILARFQRDAIEGQAKNNIRLMAKLIRGMADKQELNAGSYARLSSIIAGLSLDEIKILVIMNGLKWGLFMDDRGEKRFKDAGVKNPEAVQQALVRTGLLAMKTKSALKSPGPFGYQNYDVPNIESEHVFAPTTLMSEMFEYIKTLSLEEVSDGR